MRVGHYSGKEFMGEEFHELFAGYDIQSKPTTVKNLSAQALVEHLHLILGNQLHVSSYSINDCGIQMLTISFKLALGTPDHQPIELVLQSKPTHLDMIFRQQIKIDWQLIKLQCR